MAIEAKASRDVGKNDTQGLERFAEFYGKPHRAMIFYLGTHHRKIGRVDVLPWQEGLRSIGL